MKKILILFGCLLVNFVFSKDYEITPENREAKFREYEEQEKHRKELEEQEYKYRKKLELRQSDDRYLQLCERLLNSQGKCKLRVHRSHQDIRSFEGIGKIPLILGTKYFVNIGGQCDSDKEKENSSVHRESNNWEPSVGWLFDIRLWWLLQFSNLTPEESKAFEEIVKNRKSGTIIRDGSKLSIIHSKDTYLS